MSYLGSHGRAEHYGDARRAFVDFQCLESDKTRIGDKYYVLGVPQVVGSTALAHLHAEGGSDQSPLPQVQTIDQEANLDIQATTVQ